MHTKNITKASIGAAGALLASQQSSAMIEFSDAGFIVTQNDFSLKNWDVDGDSDTDILIGDTFTDSSEGGEGTSTFAIGPGYGRNNVKFLNSQSAAGFAFMNNVAGSSFALGNLMRGVRVGPASELSAAYRFGATDTWIGAVSNTNRDGGAFVGRVASEAANGGFTSGNSGYIGFSFDDSGITKYGWALITITDSSIISTGDGPVTVPGQLEITEWAVETSGGGINVGVIPEPSQAAVGLGLLALGAAGLRRSRR